MSNTTIVPCIWDWLKNTNYTETSESNRWPGGRPLRWHPEQLAEVIAQRDVNRPAPLSEGETEELKARHGAWRADEVAMAGIDALGEAGTLVVVTGQQPMPLGGPQMILFKTLGAIRLARKIAAQYPERKVVPVFWMAGEDHDFEEIRAANWLGNGGEMKTWQLANALNEPGRMIGTIPMPGFDDAVGEGSKTTREMILESTNPTEFRDEVLDLLAAAQTPGISLGDHFARLLLAMTAGSGLVVVDPAMPWLRRRAAEVVRAELEQPGSSTAAILERTRLLEDAGFAPSLHRNPGAVNVFWVDDRARRCHLLHEAGEWRIRDFEGKSNPIGRQELFEALERNPERFSTNVVTRPMVQDSMLPTVAQLVGPGEAAYFAQVEAAFDGPGRFAAIRWPRPQATLIEPRAARQMQKFQVGAEDLMGLEGDALRERLMRNDESGKGLAQVAELRDRHLEELAALAETIAAGDPALEKSMRKLRENLEKGYQVLVERIVRQQGKQHEQLQRASQLIGLALMPGGMPAERVLNALLPQAINFGPQWTQALLSRLEVEPGAGHQLIELADLIAAGIG